MTTKEAQRKEPKSHVFQSNDKANKRQPIFKTRQTNADSFFSAPLQPKLKVSQPNDPAEKEADRVADQVMRMEDPEQTTQQPPKVQRQASNNVALEVDGATQQKIESLKGGGQPLSAETRAFFEPRFGQDLSDVRVHTGPKADEAARSINAEAFTQGNEIAIPRKIYGSNTINKKELLAHELAHVAQQNLHSQYPVSRVETLGEHAELISGDDKKDVYNEFSVSNEKSMATHSSLPLSPFNHSIIQLKKNGSKGNKSSPSTLTGKTDQQIIKKYKNYIKWARKAGYEQAADNLEHFLSAKGDLKKIPVSWLKSYDSVNDAEKLNHERFKTDTLRKEIISIKKGQTKKVEDYWDNSLTAYDYNDLFYASGTSTIRSRGKFTLKHTSSKVEIDGVIQHDWYDYYDWHAGLAAWIPFYGSIPDTYGQQLVNNGKAAEFDMRAVWHYQVKGTYQKDRGWFWFDRYSLNPKDLEQEPSKASFNKPRGTFRD